MSVPYTFATATSPIPLANLDANFVAVGSSANVSFITAGTGANATTVQAKLRTMISVKDFGATGDGSTDDTTAINNALVAASGNSLYFPAGTYICTTLSVYSNTALIGAGAGATMIKAKSSLGGSAALLTTAATGYSNISLDGITFDGNNLQSRTAELVGFGIVADVTVKNCVFQNVGYIGLAFGGCTRIVVANNRFYNTGATAVSSEGGPALWMGLNGSTACYDGVIQGNEFHDLNWSGMYPMCNNLSIVGNIIHTVKEGGIFLNNTVNYVSISGNTIIGVTKKYISSSGIEAGCNYLSITGNTISSVDSDCISITDTQRTTISGNTLAECRADSTSFPTASGIGIISTNSSPNQPQYISISGNDFQSFSVNPYAFVSIGVSGSGYPNYISIQDNNISGNTFTSGKAISWTSGKIGATCKFANNLGATDVGYAVGEFQAPSGTGSYSVTGLDFRPSRVEILATMASTTGSYQSQSFTDGTTVTCHSIAATTSACASTTAGAYMVGMINSSGSLTTTATLTSIDEGGFTLNFTSVSGGRPWCIYRAYP